MLVPGATSVGIPSIVTLILSANFKYLKCSIKSILHLGVRAGFTLYLFCFPSTPSSTPLRVTSLRMTKKDVAPIPNANYSSPQLNHCQAERSRSLRFSRCWQRISIMRQTIILLYRQLWMSDMPLKFISEMTNSTRYRPSCCIS